MTMTGIIIFLLLVVIVLTIGMIGYYIYNKKVNLYARTKKASHEGDGAPHDIETSDQSKIAASEDSEWNWDSDSIEVKEGSGDGSDIEASDRVSAVNEDIRLAEQRLRELDEWKETYRQVHIRIAEEQEKKGAHDHAMQWDKNKWGDLIKLIKELKEKYPSLSSDFAAIEWKKVWLPALQQLCIKLEANGRGIYRIWWQDEDGHLLSGSYIGKASGVNGIKSRWYDHVKKVLGVIKSGNERLYQVGQELGVENMRFEVVEFFDEDGASNCENAKERYWIDFYAAREVGLNKV